MTGGPAAVIGLEVHVQLRTATKMFCGSAAEFGAPPNTRVCPVCLGLPGALPVPNRRAVELGVRAALGLHCTVHPRSRFARKHYFYADLPKGYQITQHDEPLATAGYLELPATGVEPPRRVRVRRVHLEEDTGKSLHDRHPDATALDLNRAGIPLVEIVTEPELRTPAEARAFLVRLRRTLEYLEVSDCNMEEGSLRVDANVSIAGPDGAPAGRTELKNLNSFAHVERALEFEIERQRRVLASGGRVSDETRLWDARRGEARRLRGKEEARDYRYFAEPDLPPLVLEPALLDEVRAGLPEMPWSRAARLERQHGVAASHAEVLTSTRALADYFEEAVAAGADPRVAAGWVMGEVLALRRAGGPHAGFAVPPLELARLLGVVERGELARGAARQVLRHMAATGIGVEQAVRQVGVAQVRDPEAAAEWVERTLAAHPHEVERYRSGETRLLGFLVGQAVRASGGRADPRQISELVRARLER